MDANKVLDAILDSILKILEFIFVWPFSVWLKAVDRVNAAKRSDSLNLRNINNRWPMLTYLKRFFFEYLFDAVSVLSYIVGILVALFMFFKAVSYSFGAAAGIFFSTIVLFYFFPVFNSILRDWLQLTIVGPVRKFVSWIDKPAQYLDINAGVKNEVKAEVKAGVRAEVNR